MTGRRWAAPAILLLAVAGTACLAAILLQPTAPIPVTDAARSVAGPKAAAPDRAPAAPAPPPPAEAPAPAPVMPPVPAAAPAGWIEVTVRAADGGPVPESAWFNAYALPAGAPGVHEIDDVPYAVIEGPEPGRIPIRLPGLYDVGVRSGARYECALARDVLLEEGGTAPVVLQLPVLRGVTFRVEGEPARDRRIRANLSVRSVGGRDSVSYPGRDDPVPWTDHLEDWDLAQPATLLVPEEGAFEYQVDTVETLAAGVPNQGEPKTRPPSFLQPCRGTTRAGEAVVLRFAPAARLMLRMRAEPPLPMKTVLHLRLEVEQGGLRSEHAFRAGAVDGREESEFSREVEVAPGPATLRWRAGRPGPGDAEVAFPEGGPVSTAFEAGRTVEIPVEIRIDAGPALEALASPTNRLPLRIEARAPGGAPQATPKVRVFCLRAGDAGGPLDEWSCWDDSGTTGSVEIPARVRGEWSHLLVCGGSGHVGEILPMPAQELLEVELRPAGLLVVSPDATLGESMGALFLRREDGGPIPSSSKLPDGSWICDDVAPRVKARPGDFLGPLQEGEHSFEVLLGGRPIGTAAATVRRDRIEILRVRTK